MCNKITDPSNRHEKWLKMEAFPFKEKNGKKNIDVNGEWI